MDKVDEEEDKKYGDSNGEPKIPDHLTSRRKLREKIKEILKDTDKAKKQIDKAKTKIKEEKVDKINLTDMDSKMMKMKVLLLTYQILHQLKNCMERQKKFPSLTTTTSSLILRKNRLYVRQDII